MMVNKVKDVKNLFTSGSKVDENFVYFIALLYCISTGEIGAVDLFKTGKDSKYGKYSDAFRDTYRLGVGWSYGLASACEMIGRKVSKQKDDPTKLLLVKLSQVVRLGDDLKTFFRDVLHFNVYCVIYDFCKRYYEHVNGIWRFRNNSNRLNDGHRYWNGSICGNDVFHVSKRRTSTYR
jgi:archaellum biogenesis protein FlaJ (TadC family)